MTFFVDICFDSSALKRQKESVKCFKQCIYFEIYLDSNYTDYTFMELLQSIYFKTFGENSNERRNFNLYADLMGKSQKTAI